MLIGEYQHSIDVKGRVIMPSKLRENLGEQFIITKGIDHCLFVYHLDEWTTIENKIKQMPIVKARQIQRFFFSGATLAEPDKQGRILIPATLREHAGIDKDVMVIGASNRVEIWAKEKWEQQAMEMTDEMVEQAMEDIGF